MKSLNKKPRKLIYITAIFIGLSFISLFFSGCSSCAIISEGDKHSLLPSFSGSGIEITDLNGGDLYPGESIGIKINVLNSGKIETRNIEVRVNIPDLLVPDEGKTAWNIDVLEAGEQISFDATLDLIGEITADTQIRLRLEISSKEIDSFIIPDYKIPVYGVRPFERNYIPIIGLHAIEEHIGEAIELNTTQFDELCRILKEYGYETITFTDLLNYVDYGKALPEKPVIITSDDGFQDVYTNGFPILKKYGYKMTVFLVTGAVGENEGDRKTNKYFNQRTNVVRTILIWSEIIEMDKYGCEFLSHTVNHARLGPSSDEEFLEELRQSKKDIESHLGKEVLFFAWPYDNHSPSKWPLIADAGYRGAVRYGNGIEDMRTINLYDIKRVEFNSYIPPVQYVSYLKLDDSILMNYIIDENIKEVGEEFEVEYTIKNTNEENIKIDSLELMLPDNVELVEVDPSGYIDRYPGISDGMYMWVSDSYIVEGENEINLILKLKGTDPGESIIQFRAAHNGSYIDCDDIEIEIKN
ncbi:MAG: polysaccharide deacetylase family protein [Actinomycetota bacterium]|nr:polysaccharide deacetylase family protein [Actinomycetota bacterium]